MTVLRHVQSLLSLRTPLSLSPTCVLVTTKACLNSLVAGATANTTNRLAHNQSKLCLSTLYPSVAYRSVRQCRHRHQAKHSSTFHLLTTTHSKPTHSALLTSPFLCHSRHRNLSTSNITMANTQYTVEERGARNSTDFRVYFSKYIALLMILIGIVYG